MNIELLHKEIGGCRIEKKLGQGGMGSVYLARNLGLDIWVALKFLDSSLAASTDALERFYTEARAAARLDSPHIVRVMRVGQDQSQHFIEMEFVEGSSLKEKLLQEAPMPYATAIQYLYQAALGLHVAHQAGVIHRDIKPENMMINTKGILKIADFGLAKVVQNTAMLTQPGQLLGTPYYLAPEQCEGKVADARSDLYSLGITLYYMLTGKLPFTGDTPLAIVSARLYSQPISPSQIITSLPQDIESCTLKMMARNPNDRYASAQELLIEIGNLIKKYQIPLPWIGLDLDTSTLLQPAAQPTITPADAELAQAKTEMGMRRISVDETEVNLFPDQPVATESRVATDATVLETKPKLPSMTILEETLKKEVPDTPIVQPKISTPSRKHWIRWTTIGITCVLAIFCIIFYLRYTAQAKELQEIKEKIRQAGAGRNPQVFLEYVALYQEFIKQHPQAKKQEERFLKQIENLATRILYEETNLAKRRGFITGLRDIKSPRLQRLAEQMEEAVPGIPITDFLEENKHTAYEAIGNWVVNNAVLELQPAGIIRSPTASIAWKIAGQPGVIKMKFRLVAAKLGALRPNPTSRGNIILQWKTTEYVFKLAPSANSILTITLGENQVVAELDGAKLGPDSTNKLTKPIETYGIFKIQTHLAKISIPILTLSPAE